MVDSQLKGHGSGPLREKRTPCLSTPLVFFHCYHGGPERVVDLGGGLGYRILICRPVQGSACGLNLLVVAGPSQAVVQLPLVKSSSVCAVLLESCRLDAIHAVRQIC
jgi:hypothetical protein